MPLSLIIDSAKMVSDFKSLEDKLYLEYEYDFDTIFKSFQVVLYHYEYVDQLKKVYKIASKVKDEIRLKVSDLQQKFEGSDKINIWIQSIILAEFEDNKDLSYWEVAKSLITNKLIVDSIESSYGAVDKEFEKYEKIKKIIVND